MKIIFLILISYLLGSIPFGIIIGKLTRGIDLREYGSGNIGAANAFRALGSFWGSIVLLTDVGKGSMAVFLANFFLIPFINLPLAQILAGLCAISGHNYSCFLSFKGGKGIATSLGVFICLSWKAALIGILIYIIIIFAAKYSSLASLCGALSIPISIYFLKEPKEIFYFSLIATLFAFYKHKENIKRLIKKEELKIFVKNNS
ncbi:MAG: glycerol-3-phosphate 1-O-acyltransferase PlsY [Armatimonadetes bacterium]|nr:glycerol-3-phosphate 1-O-acyltransferase PlsY [Armatimonadota bacterium]